jgi:hypothetical protein
MIINARPHINGNSEDDFAAAMIAISNAYDGLAEALRKVRCNVTHGRNYQHLEANEALWGRQYDVEAVKQRGDAALQAIGDIHDALCDVPLYVDAA